MAYGARNSERVEFERGIPVYMMGIDGTWRRDCLMIDVSQTGARLLVEALSNGWTSRNFSSFYLRRVSRIAAANWCALTATRLVSSFWRAASPSGNPVTKPNDAQLVAQIR